MRHKLAPLAHLAFLSAAEPAFASHVDEGLTSSGTKIRIVTTVERMAGTLANTRCDVSTAARSLYTRKRVGCGSALRS